MLPAIGVEILTKIALLIKQSHPHQWQAQFTGRLEVIARQNAQAARIDRQGLGEAKLGRKVSDAEFVRLVLDFVIPRLALQIILETMRHSLHVRDKAVVNGDRSQTLLADLAQHEDRVLITLLPQFPVQATKEVNRLMIPGPTQVMGQHLQILQPFWERRSNGKSADMGHVNTSVIRVE